MSRRAEIDQSQAGADQNKLSPIGLIPIEQTDSNNWSVRSHAQTSGDVKSWFPHADRQSTPRARSQQMAAAGDGVR
jgi:hypothetical protein